MAPTRPIPPAPPSLEDLRAYVRWMKHAHAELTQRRIAELAGLHKSSVARLELGQDVTYRTGAAVLRALSTYQAANLVGPDAPVSRIMTSPVASAWPHWTLERLYDEMAANRFSWMPLRNRSRHYVGLASLDRVAELVDAGVDPTTPLDELGPRVRAAPMPDVLDLDLPVSRVRTLLERGPPIRLVKRWGVVRGVVTPENLERVDWRGASSGRPS